MFVDQAIIDISSGKGGDGAVHFRREKYIPFGGPDGGDGGRGGDVVLQVNPRLTTLAMFRQKKKFKAQDGANGGKQNMTGRSADALLIDVPAGTIVYEDESGEVIGDLINNGDTLLIAKGGRGGKGNSKFATSRNQAPRIAERGAPPISRRLRLELKLIADVGIVGIPNAGKSTLLSMITRAKPKIASYPFTTLEPNLGVAEIDHDKSVVFADIPGLIEGAHRGIGLGHDFLRHIQRTRILIHLLDGTSDDLVSDYSQINSELVLFDPELVKKPQIVAINKIDLPQVSDRLEGIQASLKKIGVKHVHLISGLAQQNLRPLLNQVLKLLEELPEIQDPSDIPVYRIETDPNEFKIIHEQDGYRVKGIAIERAAAMTYWEHFQSIRRFQRILQFLGIDKALRDAGVQPGDTVFIGDYELEWSE